MTSSASESSNRDPRERGREVNASALVRAYAQRLPAVSRRHLYALRRAIRAAAPNAVEAFGYMPAFRLGGKGLVWYAAWKAHTSLYPVSAQTTRNLADAFCACETSGRGTVRFPLTRPIPTTLVAQLVRARIQELMVKAPAAPRRKGGTS
jgi:uncharacterized protein YdhG (YjbR/CyaY superfamily)